MLPGVTSCLLDMHSAYGVASAGVAKRNGRDIARPVYNFMSVGKAVGTRLWFARFLIVQGAHCRSKLEVQLPLPAMVLVRHVYEEVGIRLAACSNCMLATSSQSDTAVNRKERSAADVRRASSTLTLSVPTADASDILAPAGCIATVQDRWARVIAGQTIARKSSTKSIAGISFRNALPLIVRSPSRECLDQGGRCWYHCSTECVAPGTSPDQALTGEIGQAVADETSCNVCMAKDMYVRSLRTLAWKPSVPEIICWGTCMPALCNVTIFH